MPGPNHSAAILLAVALDLILFFLFFDLSIVFMYFVIAFIVLVGPLAFLAGKDSRIDENTQRRRYLG